MADPEEDLRQAMRELDAAIGRRNEAMLRASEAGISRGQVAAVTGLSVRRVVQIVTTQRKAKP